MRPRRPRFALWLNQRGARRGLGPRLRAGFVGELVESSARARTHGSRGRRVWIGIRKAAWCTHSLFSGLGRLILGGDWTRWGGPGYYYLARCEQSEARDTDQIEETSECTCFAVILRLFIPFL